MNCNIQDIVFNHPSQLCNQSSKSVQSVYKMFSSCIQPNLTVSSTDRESKIIISYGYCKWYTYLQLHLITKHVPSFCCKGFPIIKHTVSKCSGNDLLQNYIFFLHTLFITYVMSIARLANHLAPSLSCRPIQIGKNFYYSKYLNKLRMMEVKYCAYN